MNTQNVKLVVAGTRTFNDYIMLQNVLNDINTEYNIIEIVSGTANGADKLGEKYASACNIPIKRFPANWNKYGKRAGYIRNRQMVIYADAVIVFWDGVSKGTKLTIDLAKEYHKPIKIIKYDIS